MKAIYMTPSIKVKKVMIEDMLMAGSDPKYLDEAATSGGNGDDCLSKQHNDLSIPSLWDDEEDESPR